MLMGELNRRQNKFTDAERSYTEALTLQKDNKDAPETAASLAALGELYFESNKSEQARGNLTKAISIYQKNYKAASKNANAQEVYARGILNTSWLLSKIALNEQHPEEAIQQCKTAIQYKSSLTTADPKVEECERLLSAPKPSTP